MYKLSLTVYMMTKAGANLQGCPLCILKCRTEKAYRVGKCKDVTSEGISRLWFFAARAKN